MPGLKLHLIALLVCTGLLSMGIYRSGAQSEVVFENETPEYVFGDEIIFRTTVQSEPEVAEGRVFVQTDGLADRKIVDATVDSAGILEAIFSLKDNPLQTFSKLNYKYEVTLQDGQVHESPPYEFTLEDTRFDWETLEDPLFTVHWYNGDLDFAQEVLNVANSGWERMQAFTELNLPGRVHIYVYDDAEQMQQALTQSNQNWVAGHANPDLGVILVSLQPGPDQHLELERQVPHELLHVALYGVLGPRYTNLPVWFNEGLASMAELYPNPNYQILLQDAAETGTLLTMQSLCQTFPAQPEQVMLAYAQSASFVGYIYDQYGKKGLDGLTAVYMNGLGCGSGVENALGLELDQLENRWRQTLSSKNPLIEALSEWLPWLLFLVAILIGPAILLTVGILRHKPARVDL